MKNEDVIRIALWASGYDEADAIKFLDDVADVSALISEERGVWSFIHSSVQEYYAASHLMSGTDNEIYDHATLLRKVPSESTREQVFRFAAETDSFKFVKLVELPFLEDVCAPITTTSATEAQVVEWLVRHTENIAEDKNSTRENLFFTVWLNTPDRRQLRMFVPAQHKHAVRLVLLASSIAEQIESLAKLQVVGARLLEEGADRLDTYLKRMAHQKSVVEDEETNRAESGKYLQDLLKL